MNTAKAHQLLQLQQQALTQLFSLLQQECDALCEKNSVAITAYAADKQNILARVDALFVEYSQHSDPAVIPQEAQARSLWQQVKVLAEQCRQQNQVNGNMIATGRQFARRALNLLRGDTLEGDACYSRDGKAPQVLGSRAIGKV